jgi:hybrid cluster-associated redox disulfide protein
MNIDKNTNLGELIKEHPETVEIFMDYGMHCVGCVASAYDTIEQGAKVHRLSDEDIEEMVQRLKEVIRYKE